VSIAGGQMRFELDDLPAKVLSIVVERRGVLGIERDRLRQVIVDPQGDVDRFGAGWAQNRRAPP